MQLSCFSLRKKAKTASSVSYLPICSPMKEVPVEERKGSAGSGKEEDGDQRHVFFHFSHPHHPLLEVTSPYLFTCMGCKEYGAGKKLSCSRQACCFDLHDFCALAPPSLHGHPFRSKHHLVFITKPTGTNVRTRYMNIYICMHARKLKQCRIVGRWFCKL